jgi:hypothetical protein
MKTITCSWDPDPAAWVSGLTLRDTRLLDVERSRRREPRLTDTYLRVTIPSSGDLYQQVDNLYRTYLEALDFEVDDAAAAR